MRSRSRGGNEDRPDFKNWFALAELEGRWRATREGMQGKLVAIWLETSGNKRLECRSSVAGASVLECKIIGMSGIKRLDGKSRTTEVSVPISGIKGEMSTIR